MSDPGKTDQATSNGNGNGLAKVARQADPVTVIALAISAIVSGGGVYSSNDLSKKLDKALEVLGSVRQDVAVMQATANAERQVMQRDIAALQKEVAELRARGPK